MKQRIFFLVLFFVSFTQAQEIYYHPWYLYQFNVGGNDFPISYNEEIPIVQANFTQGNPDLFETGACNGCVGEVFIDTNQATMQFDISCTLSECTNSDNTDFDNAYSYFFTENSQDMYTYSFGYVDGPPGPDEVLLWITKPNGDYIIYSDLQYYFSIPENALQYLQILPNPVTQSFAIMGSKNVGALQLTLFDMNGKKVVQLANCVIGESININQLKTGIYFVSLTDENGYNLVKKLVKQ